MAPPGWHSALSLALALAGLALAGCAEEPDVAGARQAVLLAIERGDRAAALEAVTELERALPDTPGSLLEISGALLRVGSAPDAAWKLEEGVRRHPERSDLRIALARVALVLANPALALEVTQPIGEDSELHATALQVRADAELKLGNLDAALALLEEAERLHPERPEAAAARINTLLRERRTDEARAAIEALHASVAERGDAEELERRLELTLAQLRAHEGEPEAAIERLDALLEDRPDDPEVWQALVQVLVRQGRTQEALARLGVLLEGEPDPELLPLAARLHEQSGNTTEAERILRRYAATDSAGAYLPLVMLFSDRDEPEAVREVIEEALDRHPEEPSLRLLLAESLLALGDIEAARAAADEFADLSFDADPQSEYLAARLALAEGEAAEAVERLTALAPRLDRAATHYWLGRALEDTGDRDGARRRYALASRRDTSWGAPVASLAQIARARGDWPSMVSHARTLTRIAPGRLEGWSELVDALILLGDAGEAERAAQAARSRFPDEPGAALVHARALRAAGRYDEALAALEAAEPDGTDLAAERVHTLGMAGRTDEGIELARRVLADEPGRADVHAALAGLLYARGAAEEADRATDRALELAPERLQPLRVRCEFRTATGRWSQALEDCGSYVSQRPDDAGAHFMLGINQAALGLSDDALVSYARAAELDERDPRPRNNAAELLAGRGELAAALEQAQEAFRLAPQEPAILDTLGALYLRSGRAERAVVLLERAHAAEPEAPRTSLHLALAYRDAGRADEARTLLGRLEQGKHSDAALRREIEEALHSLE